MGKHVDLLRACTLPEGEHPTQPRVEVDFVRAVELFYGPAGPPAGTTYDQAVNAIQHALLEEIGAPGLSFRLIGPKIRRIVEGSGPASSIETAGPDVVEGGGA